MKRKIRMGMVGGGQGSFIGAVHRIAANLDGQIELVCGCFSSRPENSLATGQSLFLPDNRIYASYQEMIEKEAALPEGTDGFCVYCYPESCAFRSGHDGVGTWFPCRTG